jgi:hypothetical protein
MHPVEDSNNTNAIAILSLTRTPYSFLRNPHSQRWNYFETNLLRSFCCEVGACGAPTRYREVVLNLSK